MDGLKKFWRDEAGTAEAASSVAMIGLLSSGLSGAWNGLANNPPLMLLAGFVLLFFLWIIFKA